jgi:hypothetical protein
VSGHDLSVLPGGREAAEGCGVVPLSGKKRFGFSR